MYTTRRLSRYRTATGNVLRIADKHSFPVDMSINVDVCALLEARSRMEVGLSSLLIRGIAEALLKDSRYQILNSVLQRSFWGDRLVVYDTPGFSVAVSKTYMDEDVAGIYVIDDALGKSPAEINEELELAKSTPVMEFPLYRNIQFFLYLPSVIQRLLFGLSSIIPRAGAITPGSIGFSNLGPTAVRDFHPRSPKTLMFGIGGIQTSGETKLLSISVAFNHYVVDGRLVADFLDDLKTVLEKEV